MYLEVVAISILGILFFAACAYLCASRWPNYSNVVRLVWGLGVVCLTIFGMSSAQDYLGYASLWREFCIALIIQLILGSLYNKRFGVR
jgi:steroid 5-alpha reductase family enzyme